jgi:predicted ester cyclase
MDRDGVIELLRRDPTPEEHAAIRDLWKRHSIAEDRRDLDGLIATLTEDCVYEVVNTGATWTGHDGARRFYTELLSAFPDVTFTLTNIVIGPQGVSEEATLAATHRGPWQGHLPSGARVTFTVAIFFPWDMAARRFRGERVYLGPGAPGLDPTPGARGA